jgi:2'-5' RNA ligase
MPVKKAVDIVLLPPPEIMGMAVGANCRLEDSLPGIALNRADCLPHISLAMACVETGRLGEVERIVGAIGQRTGSLSLSIIGVAMVTNAAGAVVSSYIIGKTEKLQKLHEEIITALEPYLDSEASSDMFAGPGPIADSSVDWVRTYRQKSAFGNFVPHITIGLGKTQVLATPVGFTTSKLAVCHLGNHCTCRKVLWEAHG